MVAGVPLQLRDPRRAAAGWAAADRRITDQALWVSTATLDTPELVSKRLGNYQFHPVWDFIASQAWVR
jgi:peptide/nickel transport system substrate-binding protein